MKKFVFVVTFLSLFAIFTSQSFAVPVELSYQGYLTDKENVAIDGLTSMFLRLYVEGDPKPVWEEEQVVQLNNGIYSVVLGADTEGNPIEPGIFDKQVFLGIDVKGDGEMTPRLKLTSASYSIKAEDSNTAISASTAVTANTANTATTATTATSATTANSANFALDSDTVDGRMPVPLPPGSIATTVQT